MLDAVVLWNPSILLLVGQKIIRFIKLSLEFSLKALFRRKSFRSESNQFIFNMFWLKLFWLQLLFLLEIYQLFFLFSKQIIRCRNLVLEFALKLICIIWIFRGKSKNFILDGSCWKLSQLIMVLLLELLSLYHELYQLLFLFIKTFLICINISLEFISKWFAEYGCPALKLIGDKRPVEYWAG